MYNKFYIATMCTVFVMAAVVLTTFPRPAYSEVEKRELTKFPEWSWDRLVDGSFTKDVSSWFSDSEPYREQFITFSMKIKDGERLVLSKDNVTFHAAEDVEGMEEGMEEQEDELGDFSNHVNNDGKAKLANAGIIIVGSGNNLRALMAYGGVNGGEGFAKMANDFKKTFGDRVNVYAMVIPNAAEYYLPEKWKGRSKSQLSLLKNIQGLLSPDVKFVNVYNTLGNHADEPIYLHTDHHWAPLGGYYAAAEFAKKAKVDFKDLDAYERKVVHGYVGSMYGYSKDISVKESPEDFVYYEPKDIEYSTTYINYSINKEYKITKVSKPAQGPYFFKYKDGSGGAYCTFMGGDSRITHVTTSVKNGRKLLIIKDSFGNTIPGYLFFSFEDVFVVDNRYFDPNLKDYIIKNGITDLLFACSTFNAYGGSFSNNCLRLLNQVAGSCIVPETEQKDDSAKETKDASAKEKKDASAKETKKGSAKEMKNDSTKEAKKASAKDVKEEPQKGTKEEE